MFDFLSKKAVYSVLLCAAFLLFLSGCAGSPARINRMSHEEIVDAAHDKTNRQICEKLISAERNLEKYKDKSGFFAEEIKEACLRVKDAARTIFIERGYSADYCDDPDQYEKVFIADNASYFYEIGKNVSKSEEGSSLDIQSKKDNEINELLRKKNNSEICFALENASYRASEYFLLWTKTNLKNSMHRLEKSARVIFSERGLNSNYCDAPEKYQKIAKGDIKEYHINGLEIVVERSDDTACASGSSYKIFIDGVVGPDSAFALEQLLKKTPQCLNSSQHIVSRTKVFLNSSGGYLQDGYAMGKSLRRFEAHTVIGKDKLCASSCAVAFLGGKERSVEENGIILFHAPYHIVWDQYGTSKIATDCNVGKEELDKLKNYYKEMTDNAAGERLFERTMWYCSSSDGWAVKGPSAAELFSIATE